MAWGALAGAAIGAGGNSLNTLWQTLAGFKSASRYKSAVRHLRRREYQDMIFSMREAGLNPMLASGATPGHSAGAALAPGAASGDMVGAGVQSAKAVMEGQRNPSAIEKNTMGAAKDRHAAWLMSVQQALANEQIGLTKASTAKAAAEAKKALEESTSQAVHRLLMTKQAEKEGATAAQVKKSLEGSTGGNWYADPLGYVNKMLIQYAPSAADAADKAKE